MKEGRKGPTENNIAANNMGILFIACMCAHTHTELETMIAIKCKYPNKRSIKQIISIDVMLL